MDQLGITVKAAGPPRGKRLSSPQLKARSGKMNDEIFNMEVRKFLKLVGVSSQREIEQAVRDAVRAGKLKGNEKLKARVLLSVEGVGLSSASR
jgi:hypothetical protein